MSHGRDQLPINHNQLRTLPFMPHPVLYPSSWPTLIPTGLSLASARNAAHFVFPILSRRPFVPLCQCQLEQTYLAARNPFSLFLLFSTCTKSWIALKFTPRYCCCLKPRGCVETLTPHWVLSLLVAISVTPFNTCKCPGWIYTTIVVYSLIMNTNRVKFAAVKYRGIIFTSLGGICLKNMA